MSDSDRSDMTGSSPAGSVHGRMIVSVGDVPPEICEAFRGLDRQCIEVSCSVGGIRRKKFGELIGRNFA